MSGDDSKLPEMAPATKIGKYLAWGWLFTILSIPFLAGIATVWAIATGRVQLQTTINATINAGWYIRILFLVVMATVVVVTYLSVMRIFGVGAVSYVIDRLASIADSYSKE